MATIIDEVVPSSYESWRHCITVKCRLALTPEYIAGRLAALRDPSEAHTREFTRLYGEAHLRSVISWFERAQRESGPAT